MSEFEFRSRPDDASFAQWQAWRDLQARGLNETPTGFTIPEVGKAWHDLVHGEDPKRGFQAFGACTMMSMRKNLRGGRAWIDHSVSYRERDQMLIPPEE